MEINQPPVQAMQTAEPMSGKKKVYISIGFLFVVAALLVVWKLKNDQTDKRQTNYVPKADQSQNLNTSLGAEVYEQSQNPAASAVPDENPFNESSNALEGSYTNPF